MFIPALIPLLVFRPSRNGIAYDYGIIIQKRSRLLVFLFFLIFFLLLALRDITVGKDLINYQEIFRVCASSSFGELGELPWEIGYTVYNKLVSLISKDFRFFLIVTAFITLKPIYDLYSKEEKNGYLLMVLFLNMPCFLMIFSGLRQAISISIGVLACLAIQKRKYILCGLFIVLAMLFHSSAIVLFALYPAFFLKIKTNHLLYIVPALVVLYVLRVPIFAFILSLVPSKYLEFYGEMQQTGAVGMMLLFLVFLIFAFVVMDEEKMTTDDYFMRNVLLIAATIQFFVPIHAMVQRVSYYFLIFVPVALLQVVKKPRSNMTGVSTAALIVMSVFFTLYFFYTALFSGDNLLDVFPYTFLWSDQSW